MEESTDTPNTVESNPSGPGEQLRAARESEGLSREQVAHDLHLAVSIIEALERNDFDALPQTTTYLKGYIRSYAKRLGIDADPLLQTVERVRGPEPEWIPPQPAAAIEPGFRGIHWISGGVIVVVVAMLATWWIGSGSKQVESPEILAESLLADLPAVDSNVSEDMGAVALPPPPEAPEAAEETSETTALIDPVDEETAGMAQALGGADEPVSVASVARDDQATETALERNDGRDAVGDDRLALRFNEASWAEVYDANDEQLLYGLFEGGVERSLRGTAPFQVMLGYAPGVEVHINGEYYDHLTRVRRNNTVRFNIARPSDDIE